jgi:hypothetical protein
MDLRRAPARTGALVALGVLLAAATAYAVGAIRYRGKTSQGRAISFKLDGHAITELQYRIADRCPNGRLLFVHNWGLPPLRVTGSRFGGRFAATPPGQATAIITGRVSGETVSGTLSDRSRDKRTRKFCTGKAKFKLTHRHAGRRDAARIAVAQ